MVPVVVDGASEPGQTSPERMRNPADGRGKWNVVVLLLTSSSRKSILPVVEELNGLVSYPVQYEGEESSYNVFYTRAAPTNRRSCGGLLS